MRHRRIRRRHGPRRSCCSRACASSSTAATTRPACPSWAARRSTRCAPSATSTASTSAIDGGVGEDAVATVADEATVGIGHTRWATHGRVNEQNAHPHFDTHDRVHVVVNGIVENYLALRERLKADGAVFTSETDAEVIAHLVAVHYDGDLVEAVRLAYNDLEGHFAFVAMSLDAPELLVGARKECPLIVGIGDDEAFLASAVPAFLAADAPRPVRRERRDRRDRPGHDALHLARRRADRAPGLGRRLGRGHRREGRLRDVHAQGDPRAGGRRRRDDRRPHDPRGRRRPRRRRRARRRAAAHGRADRHRRLRHLVPRGPDRPLRDRGVRARAGRGRDRLRVPLPQPGRRSRRPRDRHHAVRRDGRHACRDADRARARRDGAGRHEHHGLAGHARRRRRPLHARRPRGLRRGDEDLPLPGRRHVPARAAARRAARRRSSASGASSSFASSRRCRG